MPGTLRWGILAPGWIAGEQTTDLLGAGFLVAAVGSRSLEKAKDFAARFGISNTHGSYDDLVNDPEVDIVYVASPHSGHYEHAKLALQAGKHVLLEKAFTVTEEQARVLADLATSRGVVLMEAMWTRFLPHMVRIREIIAAGTLGEVRTVIADHNQKLPADPAHRIQNPALAGGALLDLGIYPVSLAWDMLGKPSTVHAVSSLTATGVDRQTAILLGYGDGRQAVLHSALDTFGPNTASIIGTHGWIAIDSVWYTATDFTVYDSSGAVIERYESHVDNRGMQYQATEIERRIETGDPGNVLPLSESVQIMGTLDEIRRQIDLVYPRDIIEA